MRHIDPSSPNTKAGPNQNRIANYQRLDGSIVLNCPFMIPDRAAIGDRQELQAQIGRHQYSGNMIKDGRMRGTIAVIA